ncbi:glycosyltransferase family 4 protein [Plesiomonas shigelloides]|uniref:glycosyltransferase family 4 protein n=1 Tax=Plesiomonas shigelloides TaxID=703 RepID=UPI0031B76935
MYTLAISSNTSWYLYNFRKNTIKSIIDSGIKVICISPQDDYSQKLKSLGAVHVHIDIDKKGKNPFNDIKTIIQFRRILIKEKINIVLNFTPKNNIYGTIAAASCNIKVINNIAGLGSVFSKKNATSRFVMFLYKISQRYASKIFFQNEDDRYFFLDKGIVTFSKTERIPGSGTELTRFTPTLSKNDGVIRFILVARMLYEKGILHYIEAARYLKGKYGSRVEFQMLGFIDKENPSAITLNEIKNWQSEGIVNYLGVSDKVENIIANIDCMVLPSFYREGVPKSLIEGAAMGKPIITTDNIGCREVVEHGVNGYLCQPQSSKSLVEQLDKFINLPSKKRIEMGIYSRKKAEREFDERIVIKKYLQAINELMTA